MFQGYVTTSSVASQMFIYRQIIQKKFRLQCLSKHGVVFKMLRLTRTIWDSKYKCVVFNFSLLHQVKTWLLVPNVIILTQFVYEYKCA